MKQSHTFAYKELSETSKAMQTAAIGTVAKSLPQNKVILLTCLISNSYIPYTDLRKIHGKTPQLQQIFPFIRLQPYF